MAKFIDWRENRQYQRGDLLVSPYKNRSEDGQDMKYRFRNDPVPFTGCRMYRERYYRRLKGTARSLLKDKLSAEEVGFKYRINRRQKELLQMYYEWESPFLSRSKTWKSYGKSKKQWEHRIK